MSLIDSQHSGSNQGNVHDNTENSDPTVDCSKDEPNSASKSGKRCRRKLQNHSNDSSDSDDEAMSLHDSSDGAESLSGFEINLQVDAEQLKKDDFIIVKFPTDKKTFYRHYVAKILDTYESNQEFSVSCFRTNDKRVFVFPNEPDISDVILEQIVGVLPAPISCRRGRIVFGVDFHNYQM